MAKKILVLIVVVFLIVTTTACSSRQNSNPDKQQIKLGGILILTGPGASWGIASKNGINMAVEYINSHNGVDGQKIHMVYEDNRGDVPKNAIDAFHKLVEYDKTNIIIGTSWSKSSMALADLADEHKILLISPSLGLSEFNESSQYIFNTWPHDYLLSRELADYVYSQGYRKVAVIGTQQIWVYEQTKNFNERFMELGGSIELLIEPPEDVRGLEAESLKIKEQQDNIGALIVTTAGYYSGPVMAKRIREQGIGLPIFTVHLDTDGIKASERAFNGAEFLTFLTPDPQFKQQYEEKYNIPIDIGADSAYDAVMMIAQAIKQTNSTDTTILQEYLNNIKEYNGVSGHLIADGKGGFTKGYKVMKVIDGQAVEIE